MRVRLLVPYFRQPAGAEIELTGGIADVLIRSKRAELVTDKKPAKAKKAKKAK